MVPAIQNARAMFEANIAKNRDTTSGSFLVNVATNTHVPVVRRPGGGRRSSMSAMMPAASEHCYRTDICEMLPQEQEILPEESAPMQHDAVQDVPPSASAAEAAASTSCSSASNGVVRRAVRGRRASMSGMMPSASEHCYGTGSCEILPQQQNQEEQEPIRAYKPFQSVATFSNKDAATSKTMEPEASTATTQTEAVSNRIARFGGGRRASMSGMMPSASEHCHGTDIRQVIPKQELQQENAVVQTAVGKFSKNVEATAETSEGAAAVAFIAPQSVVRRGGGRRASMSGMIPSASEHCYGSNARDMYPQQEQETVKPQLYKVTKPQNAVKTVTAPSASEPAAATTTSVAPAEEVSDRVQRWGGGRRASMSAVMPTPNGLSNVSQQNVPETAEPQQPANFDNSKDTVTATDVPAPAAVVADIPTEPVANKVMRQGRRASMSAMMPSASEHCCGSDIRDLLPQENSKTAKSPFVKPFKQQNVSEAVVSPSTNASAVPSIRDRISKFANNTNVSTTNPISFASPLRKQPQTLSLTFGQKSESSSPTNSNVGTVGALKGANQRLTQSMHYSKSKAVGADSLDAIAEKKSTSSSCDDNVRAYPRKGRRLSMFGSGCGHTEDATMLTEQEREEAKNMSIHELLAAVNLKTQQEQQTSSVGPESCAKKSLYSKSNAKSNMSICSDDYDDFYEESESEESEEEDGYDMFLQREEEDDCPSDISWDATVGGDMEEYLEKKRAKALLKKKAEEAAKETADGIVAAEKEILSTTSSKKVTCDDKANDKKKSEKTKTKTEKGEKKKSKKKSASKEDPSDEVPPTTPKRASKKRTDSQSPQSKANSKGKTDDGKDAKSEEKPGEEGNAPEIVEQLDTDSKPTTPLRIGSDSSPTAVNMVPADLEVQKSGKEKEEGIKSPESGKKKKSTKVARLNSFDSVERPDAKSKKPTARRAGRRPGASQPNPAVDTIPTETEVEPAVDEDKNEERKKSEQRKKKSAKVARLNSFDSVERPDAKGTKPSTRRAGRRPGANQEPSPVDGVPAEPEDDQADDEENDKTPERRKKDKAKVARLNSFDSVERPDTKGKKPTTRRAGRRPGGNAAAEPENTAKPQVEEKVIPKPDVSPMRSAAEEKCNPNMIVEESEQDETDEEEEEVQPVRRPARRPPPPGYGRPGAMRGYSLDQDSAEELAAVVSKLQTEPDSAEPQHQDAGPEQSAKDTVNEEDNSGHASNGSDKLPSAPRRVEESEHDCSSDDEDDEDEKRTERPTRRQPPPGFGRPGMVRGYSVKPEDAEVMGQAVTRALAAGGGDDSNQSALYRGRQPDPGPYADESTHHEDDDDESVDESVFDRRATLFPPPRTLSRELKPVHGPCMSDPDNRHRKMSPKSVASKHDEDFEASFSWIEEVSESESGDQHDAKIAEFRPHKTPSDFVSPQGIKDRMKAFQKR